MSSFVRCKVVSCFWYFGSIQQNFNSVLLTNIDYKVAEKITMRWCWRVVKELSPSQNPRQRHAKPLNLSFESLIPTPRWFVSSKGDYIGITRMIMPRVIFFVVVVVVVFFCLFFLHCLHFHVLCALMMNLNFLHDKFSINFAICLIFENML